MKKIGLMLMAALSLGFVACEDITKEIPAATTISAEDIVVTYGSDLLGESIDFAALSTDSDRMKVITVKVVENLPENATLKFVMQLSANKDYSDSVLLDVIDGTVSITEWNNWFCKNFGMTSEAKNNYIRFAAYVVDDNTEIRVGGDDVWYGVKTISVSSIITDIDRDCIYFIGSAQGWWSPDSDNIEYFEDWKLYDLEGNGVYSGTFYIPADKFEFRFYKKLTGWDGGDSYGACIEDIPCINVNANPNGSEYDAVAGGKGIWFWAPTEYKPIPWMGGSVFIIIDTNTNKVTINY